MRAKRGMERPVFASFTLDVLGAQSPLLLPSASMCGPAGPAELGATSQEVSASLKERVSTLLATEFSRKVWLPVPFIFLVWVFDFFSWGGVLFSSQILEPLVILVLA